MAKCNGCGMEAPRIVDEHYSTGACAMYRDMKARNGDAPSGKGKSRPADNASLVVGGKHCEDCDTVGKGKKFDVTHTGHVVKRQTIGQKYKDGRLTQDFHKLEK